MKTGRRIFELPLDILVAMKFKATRERTTMKAIAIKAFSEYLDDWDMREARKALKQEKEKTNGGAKRTQ